MMDHSLGTYVDEGAYTGPTFRGKPLHQKNCLDGVDGCPRCAVALRSLSQEDRAAYDAEHPFVDDYDKKHRWTFTCDYCHKEKDIQESSTHRCPDEGGAVSYELCDDCNDSCSCREYDDNDEAYYDALCAELERADAEEDAAYAAGPDDDDDDAEEPYDGGGWRDDDGPDDNGSTESAP